MEAWLLQKRWAGKRHLPAYILRSTGRLLKQKCLCALCELIISRNIPEFLICRNSDDSLARCGLALRCLSLYIQGLAQPCRDPTYPAWYTQEWKYSRYLETNPSKSTASESSEPALYWSESMARPTTDILQTLIKPAQNPGLVTPRRVPHKHVRTLSSREEVGISLLATSGVHLA